MAAFRRRAAGILFIKHDVWSRPVEMEGRCEKLGVCVCESVSVSLYACLTRQPASLLRSPLRGDVQSGPMRGLHVNLHVCTCIGSLGL